MIELSLNKLQKYYGANMVLKDVTFDIQASEKVGVVGVNGCGKSSLLKIIMGLESYENGTISIKKNSTLGYLEQMPVYPESYKVIDVLNTAFEKIDDLQRELGELEGQLASIGDNIGDCPSSSEEFNMENQGAINESNMIKLIESNTFSKDKKASGINDDYMERVLNKYSKVQAIYESLGGYEKEEKLSKVCVGLKINDRFKEKLFLELSGGEKTTVILGKILLQNPDILLLDEPSNHLDLETMEWLEVYLNEYKGIVLIVSHDRYFLDNVVTRIIEIEDMVSKSYDGNYTAYVNEKERVLNLQMEAFINQQKKIKSIESSISRLRDWGMRGDNEKFFKRAASLLVRNKERVALIGANGCGKSTLIRILLGNLEADGGTAVLGSGKNWVIYHKI